MRISPITPNISVKKNINFKADVSILPMSARENLPDDDIFLIERAADEVKDEFKRLFPDKNDNLQIFVQPAETRYANEAFYFDTIKAFIGYKDAERARTDILKRNQTPPDKDYVTLHYKTIEKLKNKEPEMMKKLGEKAFCDSMFYLQGGNIDEIKTNFIDRMKKFIKNRLDYGLTEWVDEPYTIEPHVTELYLPPWL